MRSAQSKVTAVQGDARMSLEAEGRSGSANQFLAAERPDRLHVETLDFFGNVATVLAAGGGRFALYDAREKVFYRGRATPGNLARLVVLPLTAGEIVEILCGGVPLPGEARGVEPLDGALRLDLSGPEGSATLRVAGGAAVERAELRPEGRPPYVVLLGGRRGGEVRLPAALDLRAESPPVKVELRWKSVETNPSLDPALFRLEPPGGARVVDLDEGGGRE